MTTKTITQLVDKAGDPICTATSAPGCFIHDGLPLARHIDLVWGTPFGEPHAGNHVDFYVTGEEYFTAVAGAIAKAKKSIFITGWQVNFDVELVAGKTLYQCLEKAIDANPALRVYIMPWLSPKVGVDTGDFETMLAIFQLNAGLPPPARAFALPAIAQSDMEGGLGIGFSHHQKLVVIDQERAFVGGIDLAYGRRDDGKCSLSANGRTGNELYNPCIPPIHTLTNVEQTQYLTRAELLAACFEGTAADIATFATSAPARPVAALKDVMQTVGDAGKDARKALDDLWSTTDLVPEFVRRMQDIPVDATQQLSRLAYRRLDKTMQGQLERLRATGSAHAADAAAVLLAWLNNASLDQLPHELRAKSVALIEAFTIGTLSHLSASAGKRKTRYANLQKLRKIVPASGKVISSAQPRMPWHDVHSSITGPAVSDLSKNFVRRWNSIAHRYEKSHGRVVGSPEINAVFGALGLPPVSRLQIPRLPRPPLPKDMAKTGSSWVQVLRSTPLTMLRDEDAAAGSGEKETSATGVQNDCLKAMLTAIHGSQKFIYIEGQFFQSAFGEDLSPPMNLSSPMAALLNIQASPSYEKHARRLGIFGVPPDKILSSIRWSQVDDVRRDVTGRGAEFLNDLNVVLKNQASVQASLKMGESQDGIDNPIGKAIALRIQRAILDRVPFHVYMVLPAHPEGTLNTINIMTQLHLTMQSLVFGSESLINQIRRTLLAAQFMADKKIKYPEAEKAAKEYGLDKMIAKIGDDWKTYLTLLNLRSWELLQNRPTTEQVYVHSKLMIADDRIAVLGSANINDRSLLGGRDSELALVIRDDQKLNVQLDGIHAEDVSQNVHNLRKRLWAKLFGLESTMPATTLRDLITRPAAPSTWKAIQAVAYSNAVNYRAAFKFLPRVDDLPSSIWPAWNSTAPHLDFLMPFNERFWRKGSAHDQTFSWDAKQLAAELSPQGIQGFIVAFPTTWTANENNVSGMNIRLLAGVLQGSPEEAYAVVDTNYSTAVFERKSSG